MNCGADKVLLKPLDIEIFGKAMLWAGLLFFIFQQCPYKIVDQWICAALVTPHIMDVRTSIFVCQEKTKMFDRYNNFGYCARHFSCTELHRCTADRESIMKSYFVFAFQLLLFFQFIRANRHKRISFSIIVFSTNYTCEYSEINFPFNINFSSNYTCAHTQIFQLLIFWTITCFADP